MTGYFGHVSPGAHAVFRRVRDWLVAGGGEGWPIRGHLAFFAALLVIPAIAFSAFLIARFDAQQRSAAEARVQQLAGDLADDVSTELERGIVMLKILGLSGELQRGDLAAFHDEARRAIEPLEDVVLLMVDPNGRQLLNTYVEYGTTLQVYNEAVALNAVLSTREPYVTDLFFGRTRRVYVVNVLVPVIESGEVRYMLVLSYSHHAMRKLIETQQTGSKWAGRLIDRKGVIIAGPPGQEHLTGTRLPDHLLPWAQPQSAHRVLGVGGLRVVRATAATRLGGWTATANVEERRLEEGINRAVRELVLLGLALLVLTSGVVLAYGRYLAGSMHGLALAAEGRQTGTASGVREANQAARLLRRITGDLRESRHALQAAIDVAGMAAWAWDEVRQEKHWTSQTKAIFGLPPEAEMTKRCFVEMLHPDDLERYHEAWRKALDPDGTHDYRLEYRIRRANDGAERWICSQAAVEFEGRQPVRVVGAMRDITDEKLASQSISQHVERQSLLLAVTHELISSDTTEAAVASKVFAAISNALAANICFTFRLAEGASELELVFAEGLSAEECESARWLPIGEALCGRAAERRSPMLADARVIASDRDAAILRSLGATAYSCHPLFAKDGRVLGTFAVASRTRTTFTREEHDFLQTVANFLALAWERIQAERQIGLREAHVRSILDNTLAFVGIVARDGTLLEANEAALKAGGLAREDVIGRKFWDCYWWAHDEGEVARLRRAVERVGHGEIVRYDAVVRMAGDSRMTIDFMLSPARDETGAVKFMVPSGFDITQRKQGEMQIRLLMREVNHRAKNLLAVVQSIARHTARESDPANFLKHLTDRIGGLSASQDLLVQSGWQGVELGELVHSQLMHFSDLVGKRVVLEGPRVRINAAAAQAIGMAVHELSTNSGKYGALSNDEGIVKIRWDLAEADRFEISWQEEAGPVVEPPARHGFGYTVTVRMVEHALSGKVTLAYPASGVLWQLVAPACNTLEPPQSTRATPLPELRS